MKRFLPYNVLLVLTAAFTGLMVFYNLYLRDSFGTMVKYQYPAVPQPEVVSAPPTVDFDDEEENEQYEYENRAYDEQVALTSVTFPLDINRATEEELKFIPNVGDVMSQRIVQYREVLGGYTSLEQLRQIKGVGDATFERISAYLIIESEPDS